MSWPDGKLVRRQSGKMISGCLSVVCGAVEADGDAQPGRLEARLGESHCELVGVGDPVTKPIHSFSARTDS